MTKKEYWKSLTSDKKQELADNIGVSKQVIANIMSGAKLAGADFAHILSKATGYKVPLCEFRPVTFKKGWRAN